MTKKSLRKKINDKIWWILRDIRLWYLFTFKPEYVQKQIRLRKGECPPDCGNCCRPCKHLTKDNRCDIYPERPVLCKISPVDVWDKAIIERIVGKCYLYWEMDEK